MTTSRLPTFRGQAISTYFVPLKEEKVDFTLINEYARMHVYPQTSNRDWCLSSKQTI